MNIQFMTEGNAKEVTSKCTGEKQRVYLPDFDELVRNASCDEEIKAIKEVEAMVSDSESFFDGFPFEIVYMACEIAYVYEPDTGKHKSVNRWQMLQYPWYRTCEGVYSSKEEMMEHIIKTNR